MNNCFNTTMFVSFVYFIFKLIEIKYIQKKELILKDLIRDTVIVAISTILAVYSLEQLNIQEVDLGTTAYTGKPEF